MATIEAIRRIKAELPGVYTTLGAVQRQLRPQPGGPPRAQLACSSTSASRPGLDSAIVHAAKIMPLARIPDEQRDVVPRPHLRPAGRRGRAVGRRRRLRPAAQAARRVRRREGREAVEKEDRSDWPVEQRLSQRIIDGDRDGLTDDLDEAMAEGLAAARHHQRRAARRHEGGRRALRHGRDAAARSCCSRPRP